MHSMTSTIRDDAPTVFEGYQANYYLPRLADSQLCVIEFWAKYAMAMQPASRFLANYLFALVAFERERRDAIASGGMIIEASMPALPAHIWSNEELGGALGRLMAISFSVSDGELRELFRKLCSIVVAETQVRLGLTY